MTNKKIKIKKIKIKNPKPTSQFLERKNVTEKTKIDENKELEIQNLLIQSSKEKIPPKK